MAPVTTIDTQYLGRPGFAAAYLLVEGGEAAFIENNTARALPLLLEALGRAGLRPEQVKYAVVTHAHLDHAGGSSALMEACPGATLLAHPRAAKHLVDPSRLVASATQVYGPERFRELYGEIRPIPASRVRAMEDGERLRFGARELEFFHTRGHANHHLCVRDSGSNGIFTGDAFGLVYPALARSRPFAFPSTSPTDFDAEAAKAAVRQIASGDPERVFLTHFGERAEVADIAEQLLRWLDFYGELFARARDAAGPPDELEDTCRRQIEEEFLRRLEERGISTGASTGELLELDVALNAQGIALAAQKARGRSPGGR